MRGERDMAWIVFAIAIAVAFILGAVLVIATAPRGTALQQTWSDIL